MQTPAVQGLISWELWWLSILAGRVCSCYCNLRPGKGFPSETDEQMLHNAFSVCLSFQMAGLKLLFAKYSVTCNVA